MSDDGQTIDLERVRSTKAYRQRKAQLSNRQWRLDNLYFIRSEQGERIPFVRNPAQQAFYADMALRNIIPKARKLGFSTFIELLMLDTCIFKSGTVAGIVDRSLDDAVDKLGMIAFGYDNLPPEIRDNVPLTRRNDKYLEWSNGSSVSVGTSYRGGSPSFLHVSEYGKISVDSPEAAVEIKTGAITAVPMTGQVFVESTWHGTGGEFSKMTMAAKALRDRGAQLTPLDFRFHFYGWWMKPDYRLQNNLIIITQELREYFKDLEAKFGIRLDADQIAWYQNRFSDLGLDKTHEEFPSSPEELFQTSNEGAFFRREMSKARQEKRIGELVPFDPTRRVNTFCDIGEDTTAIWWHQTDGLRHRFIDYYEEEGWSLQGACAMIDEKRRSRKFVYDKHYAPHDMGHRDWGNNAQTRKQIAKGLGVDFVVVDRVDDKADAIESARRMIGLSWFDAEHCGIGVDRLDNYHKKWNKALAIYTSEPEHGIESHGADALQTGACGFVAEKPKSEGRSRSFEERRTTPWAS